MESKEVSAGRVQNEVGKFNLARARIRPRSRLSGYVKATRDVDGSLAIPRDSLSNIWTMFESNTR